MSSDIRTRTDNKTSQKNKSLVELAKLIDRPRSTVQSVIEQNQNYWNN